jgi:hypothetical protein
MRRLRALQSAARYAIGQRVHVVGSWRYATVSAVEVKAKATRYRLVGSDFRYFESDLEVPA